MNEAQARMRVIAVIKNFSDGLRAEKNAPPSHGDEERRVRAVLRSACERVGLTQEEYAAALTRDTSLATLERDAIVQALAGLTDPGPHDAISRESPSGRPGDTAKRRVS